MGWITVLPFIVRGSLPSQKGLLMASANNRASLTRRTLHYYWQVTRRHIGLFIALIASHNRMRPVYPRKQRTTPDARLHTIFRVETVQSGVRAAPAGGNGGIMRRRGGPGDGALHGGLRCLARRNTWGRGFRVRMTFAPTRTRLPRPRVPRVSPCVPTGILRRTRSLEAGRRWAVHETPVPMCFVHETPVPMCLFPCV